MPRPAEFGKPSGPPTEATNLGIIDTLDVVDASVQTSNTKLDTLDASTKAVEAAVKALTDPLKQLTIDGKAFTAGSGRINAGGATNVRGLLRNPAGSGKNLFLHSLVAMCTQTVFGELRINPNQNLPSAARLVANKKIGGPAAVGLVDVDTSLVNPLGGGTLGSTALSLPANSRSEIRFHMPYMLAPGISLGLAIPLTGAGDLSFNLVWWEEPV